MISDLRAKQLNKFLNSLNLKCNVEQLDVAFTHSSFCNENNKPFIECNERLEFLGDAVLKLLISNYLYKRFPEYHEGDLSFIRSTIVSDETLEKIAKKIDLPQYLVLGKAEESTGGRKRSSTIACAFEGLLGALYLSGDIEQIAVFLEKLFEDEITFVDREGLKVNPKAMLQEYCQSISTDLPEYVLTKQAGPPHDRTFFVDVMFKGEFLASGKGATKKAAQKLAAQNACQNLGLIKSEEEK